MPILLGKSDANTDSRKRARRQALAVFVDQQRGRGDIEVLLARPDAHEQFFQYPCNLDP